MSVSAYCPNCGAPFTFHVSSSVVTVCESCNTVLARTDRSFEDLGKTSDLAQTQSPLQLWLGGSYQGVGFQITGRAQLRHGAGGVWDEWYLAFDDGNWGWLAEAQGRFYLTFRRAVGQPPDPRALAPGQWIQVGDPPVALAVAETGEAEQLGGRGEIPYPLQTGKRYGYADLSGQHGEFATLDFSEQPPALFLGREVTLQELGVAGAPMREDVPGMPHDLARPEVSVQAVSCENCGGSLELRAPDRTERVACPYCGAMHDCNQGVLKFLKVAEGAAIGPGIPLGSQGHFDGLPFTVIGFVMRSVRSYGQRFRWSEYLLYNPREGFRWLAHADGHWNYLTPIPIGAVHAREPGKRHVRGDRALYDGKSFVVFSEGKARVDYVAGEFYWKVERGEKVATVDYIRPPRVLSGELASNEVNWTLGRYLTQRELAACFPGVELPDDPPVGVAPHQPYRHKGVYWVFAGLLALAIAAMFWARSRQSEEPALVQRFEIPARTPVDGKPPALGPDDPDVFFSKPFDLRGDVNLRVIATAGKLSNTWMYVECDLYNEKTGRVVPFAIPIEHYFGNTGGESWREGGLLQQTYLSAVPAGRYLMRVSVLREAKHQVSSNELRLFVTQGVFRWRYWLVLMILLSLVPGIAIAYHSWFERKRWSQSDFAPDDD